MKNRVLRIVDPMTPRLIEGILAPLGVGIVVVNRLHSEPFGYEFRMACGPPMGMKNAPLRLGDSK
jgi:hypothetical protein